MMIKITPLNLMLMAAGALITAAMMASCNQFPIFYTVSKEIAPKKPKIPGSPTKIVDGNNTLYTSNGTVWYANGKNWTWNKLPQQPPGGTVRDIVYAGSLYALTIDNTTSQTAIWQYENSKWTSVLSGGNLQYQALHTDGSSLVIVKWNGTNNDDHRNYAVVNQSGNVLVPQIHFVSGVAGNLYATLGSGIWSNDKTLEGSAGKSITGIIDTGSGGVLAVSSTGDIFLCSGDTITYSAKYDYSFTGALAVWKNSSPDGLILIGTQINSIQFGYREMRLPIGSSPLAYPGSIAPSSVGGDTESYAATIEARALAALKQAPGTENMQLPILFASTQNDGLWSYREDSSLGKPAWNREE